MITRVKPDIIYPSHTIIRWPGPVRDCTGAVVPRIIVARQETTCTRCGETSTEGWCYRCDARPGANKTNSGLASMVPTVDYLREGEYLTV